MYTHTHRHTHTYTVRLHLGKCGLDVLVTVFLVVERPFVFKSGGNILIRRPNLVSVRQGLSLNLEYVLFLDFQ